jgi:precorrin-3B C17-methyltransferase
LSPGRLAVVGLGPGDAGTCTPDVVTELTAATDRVGYGRYLDLAAGIVPLADGAVEHRTDNREEADRAAHAIQLAAEGRHVVVISSGDPGIFAIAAAVMEQLDGTSTDVEVVVHPGVSAAQVAAARAGAPLGHDFCVISLSDNLKPWSIIERRLDAAAGADFVLALYNPKSKARPDQFARAVDVLLQHRDSSTPVVLGRSLGRPGEVVEHVTLGQLTEAEIDMATVVLVGSSQTRTIAGRWTYTPRSHPG